MSDHVVFLEPAVYMSLPGVEQVIFLYMKMSGGVPPSTLMVSLDLVLRAYETLSEIPHKLMIVPVPGMRESMWAACGGAGMVVSDVF